MQLVCERFRLVERLGEYAKPDPLHADRPTNDPT
jgi:hypothetical protein